MNRQHKSQPLMIRDPAYRRAFQRLDQALERETEISAAEEIQQIYGRASAAKEAPRGAARVNDPS